MKLSVYRPVNHLSHSSLQEWARCQMLFYLKRMSKYEWPKNPQGKAAAIGSVFDCVVKDAFLKRKNQPNNLKKDLLNSLEPENRIDSILKYGQNLAQQYIEYGFLDHLIKEGLENVLIKREGILEVNGLKIPMLGFPDGLFSDGSTHEWKVRGAMSKSGAHNSPGYIHRVIDGVPDPFPHVKASEPMHNLNRVWAEQLTIYDYFSYGKGTLKIQTPVSVDEIAIKPHKGKLVVRMCRIRSFLTPEFKQQVIDNLVKVFLQIEEAEFEAASPTIGKCNMWGQVCPVAIHCSRYQETLGPNADPDMKACLA